MKAKAAPAYCSTLLRGLSILKCFAETNQALGASDIARLTGIPQPTVWRFCQTLQSEGYLISDSTGTRFQTGLAVLSLGYSAVSRFGIVEHARPYLVKLAQRFHAVCGISVPERLTMRVIQRHQGPDAVLSYNIRVGWSLAMANSASGWAYLAGVGEAERLRLIAGIEREQAEQWARFKDQFAKALKDYAKLRAMVNVDAFYPGLTAVALPLPAADGNSRYVMYCTAMGSMLPKRTIREELVPEMKRIAETLRPLLTSDAFA